jgi:hypothetical protein
MEIATLAALILTALFTYWAARAASQSLTVGARAYIVAKRGFAYNGYGLRQMGTTMERIPLWPLTPDSHPVLVVELVNSGGTPAVDVKMQTFSHILDHLPADDEESRTPPTAGIPSKAPIAKDGELIAASEPGEIEWPPGAPIGASDAQAVMERRKFLVIFGKVTYKDVFDKRHATLYCYRFEAGQMALCPAHNSIDADPDRVRAAEIIPTPGAALLSEVPPATSSAQTASPELAPEVPNVDSQPQPSQSVPQPGSAGKAPVAPAGTPRAHAGAGTPSPPTPSRTPRSPRPSE